MKRTGLLHKPTSNFAENYIERQELDPNLLAETCNVYRRSQELNLAEMASAIVGTFSYDLS